MSEEPANRAKSIGAVLVLAAAGIAVLWLLTRAQPIETVAQPAPAARSSTPLQTNAVTARCLTCNGRGSTPAGPCSVCKGKGVITMAGVHTETREVADPQTSTTVRAALSPWERMLAAIGLAPDLNAKPQRALNGTVPLVEQYLALAKPDGPDYEILQWHPVEASGPGWIQKVTCQVRQGGSARQVTRAVFVLNRRVIRSAALSESLQ